jgi:valyl-tRNA synthetase
MLPKAYDPSAVEDRIYAMWEASGAFTADPMSTKETFVISMPPPNATGQLHLGHAVMLAIEDILIRFARMRGKEALWVPGTDHAAIATENVVIKKIQKEEKMRDPRAELGREKLLERIHRYVEDSKKTIRSQIRKMGASCDWTRERYTMEDTLSRMVNEVFVRMYRDGLIYRGHRIVNWDPKLQTTVSDDEIVYEERREPFYTFRYGPFEISTSRPETKFGDKYVVMHPDDERYAAHKHGDTFTCEWINGPVTATIIKDKSVDPAFGTGVMTITPWHDHVDFDIAEHHGLQKEQIIGFDGKLLPVAGEFSGMGIVDARPKIVEKLKEKGLLVSVRDDYVHNVALSQRGKGMIEPQIKEQWFIDVKKNVVHWKRRQLSLKEIMHEVVKTGAIRIIPERFEKVYFHWIDNLRDWCISRQIWWGHRIPVWYRDDAGSTEMYVGTTPPEGKGWERDPDTLDTWFSAALWTWSTLVDPTLAEDHGLSLEEILLSSPDFVKFHPTSVLETGYDILPFWVARMILMTTYVTGSMADLEYGQVPFDTVYFHGLVRTRDGRKMSKSDPETMIDPLDMIATYGADALRLSMIVGQSPGADMRLYEEKIAGYRNFVNKLWNAARFILLQCEQRDSDPKTLHFNKSDTLSLADEALYVALQDCIVDVTKAIEEYRLSEAGERLYSFVWDFFCDWYLELSKGEQINLGLLVSTLRTILILLHPYCPFVTEVLWEHVGDTTTPLIRQSWPRVFDVHAQHRESYDHLQRIIAVITALRRLRNEYGVEAGKPVDVVIVAKELGSLLEEQSTHIRRLAGVGTLTVQSKKLAKKVQVASEILIDIEVHMLLDGVIDVEKERARLTTERNHLQAGLAGVERKLKDASFVEKAPPAIVEGERTRSKEMKDKLVKIEEKLKIIG